MQLTLKFSLVFSATLLNVLAIFNNLSEILLNFLCKQSCLLQNEGFAYLFLSNSCTSISFVLMYWLGSPI